MIDLQLGTLGSAAVYLSLAMAAYGIALGLLSVVAVLIEV